MNRCLFFLLVLSAAVTVVNSQDDLYEYELSSAAMYHPLAVPLAHFSSIAKHLYSQAAAALRPLSLSHYLWTHVDPQHSVHDSMFHQVKRLADKPKPGIVNRHHSGRSLKANKYKIQQSIDANELHKKKIDFHPLDAPPTPGVCQNGGFLVNGTCFCPTDWNGVSCESRRHFRCKIRMISDDGAEPQDCFAATEALTTPDPAYATKCRYVSLDENALSVSFQLSYTCEMGYVNVTQMWMDYPGTGNLSYIYANLSENLVFSTPGSLQLKLKVYNLNRLYDDSQVHTSEYSIEDVFINRKISQISFEPALVPSHFAAADRVYIEITPNSTTLKLVDGNVYGMLFEIPKTFQQPPSTISTSAIIALVCVPVILIVGGFYGFRFWKRYRTTAQYQALMEHF